VGLEARLRRLLAARQAQLNIDRMIWHERKGDGRSKVDDTRSTRPLSCEASEAMAQQAQIPASEWLHVQRTAGQCYGHRGPIHWQASRWLQQEECKLISNGVAKAGLGSTCGQCLSWLRLSRGGSGFVMSLVVGLCLEAGQWNIVGEW